MKKLLLPKGLDLTNVLPDGLHKHAIACTFFLGMLSSRRLNVRDKHQFFACKRAYLRRYFPDEGITTKCLNHLIEHGVIQCDRSYIPGAKSKGYRLGPDWIDAKMRVVNVEHKLIERKLSKVKAEERTDLTPDHADLLSNLRMLTIDEQARYDVAKGLLDSQFSGDESLMHAWAWQDRVIDSIRDGSWEYKPCPITGRINSCLTYLRRDLRPYLSLQGQSLVQIDTTACHPLLLGVTVISNRTPSTPTLPSTPPPSTPTSLSPIPPSPSPIPLEATPVYVTGFESDLGDGEDLEEWVRLCEQGLVYEKLLELLADPSRDRAWVKLKLLSEVCYGECKWTGQLIDLVKAHFPSLDRAIREAKREDHGDLARSMMRLESKIVIDTASKEMVRRGVWCGTIHDAVVCLPGDADTVESVLRDAYASHGVKPKFKVSSFCNTRDAVNVGEDIEVAA